MPTIGTVAPYKSATVVPMLKIDTACVFTYNEEKESSIMLNASVCPDIYESLLAT